MGKDVLVVDGGGRGHALAEMVARSPQVGKVYVAPGNGGTTMIAENVPISATDTKALADFAERKGIVLTIVGMDDALAKGIVDEFQRRGLRIFGPTREAARIEWSKVYAKGLMQQAGILTAPFETFDSFEAAVAHVMERPMPCVIKADGLALGKGVTLCSTIDEAIVALQALMVDGVQGDAGKRVVIEDLMIGPEFTAHALTDGSHYGLFPPTQDYKRIGEGDTGPNTGGMGAVGPLPWVTDRTMQRVGHNIVEPALETLRGVGTPFVGCLYPGLMAVGRHTKVVEFNCRPGDPELQLYAMLADFDFIAVTEACINGTFDPAMLKWRKGFAACVVLASGGYPGPYAKDKPITLPSRIPIQCDLFHAGTRWADDDTLVTSGGRVIGVTAHGSSIHDALGSAYELAEQIEFNGKYYRRDIGYKTLELI